MCPMFRYRILRNDERFFKLPTWKGQRSGKSRGMIYVSTTDIFHRKILLWLLEDATQKVHSAVVDVGGFFRNNTARVSDPGWPLNPMNQFPRISRKILTEGNAAKEESNDVPQRFSTSQFPELLWETRSVKKPCLLDLVSGLLIVTQSFGSFQLGKPTRYLLLHQRRTGITVFVKFPSEKKKMSGTTKGNLSFQPGQSIEQQQMNVNWFVMSWPFNIKCWGKATRNPSSCQAQQQNMFFKASLFPFFPLQSHVRVLLRLANTSSTGWPLALGAQIRSFRFLFFNKTKGWVSLFSPHSIIYSMRLLITSYAVQTNPNWIQRSQVSRFSKKNKLIPCDKSCFKWTFSFHQFRKEATIGFITEFSRLETIFLRVRISYV